MSDEIICIISMGCVLIGILMVYEDEISRLRLRDIFNDAVCNFKGALLKYMMKKDGVYHDRELFSSSVILKNLSLVRQETPLSADYIYENLMNNSELLKPMYGEMLTLYRSGRDVEAFRIPSEFIGTKAAKNFAVILSKIDKINPAELTEQMDIFQTMMIERRTTAATKKNQRNSIIITTISSVAVFALIINFAVVVVFTDAIIMLNNLFV